jgi:hypothetical protein
VGQCQWARVSKSRSRRQVGHHQPIQGLCDHFGISFIRVVLQMNDPNDPNKSLLNSVYHILTFLHNILPYSAISHNNQDIISNGPDAEQFKHVLLQKNKQNQDCLNRRRRKLTAFCKL